MPNFIYSDSQNKRYTTLDIKPSFKKKKVTMLFWNEKHFELHEDKKNLLPFLLGHMMINHGLLTQHCQL